MGDPKLDFLRGLSQTQTMWLEILTDGTRTDTSLALRTFAIGSRNGDINEKVIRQFHIQGVNDLPAFDKFVGDNLGQPIEYETEMEGADMVVYFNPYSMGGGIKFVGASILEGQESPNETDWTIMSAKLMKMYAKEFEEVSRHLRFIQDLESELREEIERTERKATFFRDANLAKEAEMQGRLNALRLMQTRLKSNP